MCQLAVRQYPHGTHFSISSVGTPWHPTVQNRPFVVAPVERLYVIEPAPRPNDLNPKLAILNTGWRDDDCRQRGCPPVLDT